MGMIVAHFVSHSHPIRVLLDGTAIPADLGGVGRYVDDLVPELVEQGVDLTMAVQERDAEHFATRLPSARIIPISQRFESRPARMAWEQTGLPKLIRKVRPDVLHSPHYTSPQFPGVPVVITLRDPDPFTTHGSAYFHRALEITRKRADAIIVPSQATADDCVEAGLDASRITVIPHGLSHTPVTDAQVEEFRSRHGLERPYVLWVGTREPRKNLPTLLAAYEQLQGTDLDLVLVGPAGWGSDPTDAPLPAGRVHVLGRLDDTDLACAYAGARVFTFPSIWEGFGLPVLEAMAHGTPVVTSADTCMAEITGADAGLLVPATDASALAEALEAAAGSAHDRLAAAGIERARDYTWEASAAAHAAIYASLAGDR